MADLYRIRGTTLTAPDGKTVPLVLAGRGQFTRVYLLPDGETVLLATNDPMKEMLAHIDPMKHVPRVEFLGNTADKELYTSPRYITPLRAAHGKAWQQFRTLAVCWNQARWKLHATGYMINEAVFECALKALTAGTMSHELVDAIEVLKNWAANYGEEMTFEFATRNLAVDATGDLILLDVLFDRDAVRRKLEEQRRRYEGRRRFGGHW